MSERSVSPAAWRLLNARWHFLVNKDSADHLRWWWRAVGSNGVTWEGNDDFTSLAACQTDATRHGFEGKALGLDAGVLRFDR